MKNRFDSGSGGKILAFAPKSKTPQPLPETNPWIAPLLPVDSGSLRAPEDLPVVPTSRIRGLVVQLKLLRNTNYQDYQVEIYDVEDREQWTCDGFLRQEDFVAVNFPPELRMPGYWNIRLFGITEDDADFLDEYELSLADT